MPSNGGRETPQPFTRDRDATCAWDCTQPTGHDGPCGRETPQCATCGGRLWLCEQHPALPFPHAACAGPGMPCQCLAERLRHETMVEVERLLTPPPAPTERVEAVEKCATEAKIVAVTSPEQGTFSEMVRRWANTMDQAIAALTAAKGGR